MSRLRAGEWDAAIDAAEREARRLGPEGVSLYVQQAIACAICLQMTKEELLGMFEQIAGPAYALLTKLDGKPS